MVNVIVPVINVSALVAINVLATNANVGVNVSANALAATSVNVLKNANALVVINAPVTNANVIVTRQNVIANLRNANAKKVAL